MTEATKRRSRSSPSPQYGALAGGYLGQLTGNYPDGEAHYGVLAIHEEADGTMWFGGRFGCLRRTPNGELTTFAVPTATFAWFQHRLWCWGFGGVITVDPAHQTPPLNLPFVPFLGLKTAPDGQSLWSNVRYAPGLWRTVDGQTWEPVPPLSHYTIRRFWFAPDGTVWAIAEELSALLAWHPATGLRTIPFPKHRYIHQMEDLLLFVENDQTLWLGTSRAGLWYGDGQTWQRVKAAKSYVHPGVLGARILTIQQDTADRMWITTPWGLHLGRDGVWWTVAHMLAPPDASGTITLSLTPKSFQSALLGRDGRLWCGTPYGHVLWFDTTQPPQYISLGETPRNFVELPPVSLDAL